MTTNNIFYSEHKNNDSELISGEKKAYLTLKMQNKNYRITNYLDIKIKKIRPTLVFDNNLVKIPLKKNNDLYSYFLLNSIYSLFDKEFLPDPKKFGIKII